MLIILKVLLNSYTDDELLDKELWVNSSESVENIIIDEYRCLDLITSKAELTVNGNITKEGKC